MNIIFFILIICPLATSINSAEIENFNNSSDDNAYLRSKYDPDKASKVVDLNGDINRKFAIEVAALNQRASVVCSPHLATRSLMWLLYTSMANTTSFHASPERTFRELLNAAGYRDKKQLFEETMSAGGIFPKSGYLYMDFKAYVNKRSHVKRYFKNIFTKLDLSNAKSAAATVNGWVKHETDGKITSLVSENDFKYDFSFMMISVATFRNQWNFEFNRTYSTKFSGVTKQSTVYMMTTKDTFLYGRSEELDAEIITMQCKYDTNSPASVSSDIYVTIILPSPRYKLAKLVHELTQKPLLINSFKQEYQLVELHLPRFKIESSLNLVALLKQVGLKELFPPEGAGLNGILDDGPIRLDRAWQSVLIEIDEYGVKGTIGGSINPTDRDPTRQQQGKLPKTIDKIKELQEMKSPSPIFKANRPFMFFVTRYRQSSNRKDYKRDQLFAGTFVA